MIKREEFIEKFDVHEHIQGDNFNYPECEILELKEKFNKDVKEKIEKTINAFLNTSGGIIIIGITDEKKIIGLKENEIIKALIDIKEIISKQIYPNLIDAKTEIEKIGNKKIVVIKIKKGSEALYNIEKYGRSSKACYKRIGSSNVPMSENEIDKRFRKMVNPNPSIVEKKALHQDLSFSKLKIFLKNEKKINNKELEKKYCLKTSDGKYNYMAEILADKNNISISVVTFKGIDKSRKKIEKEEFGNRSILEAFVQVKNYIELLNKKSFDTSVRPRIEKERFNFEAFNEAWVNACVHNKWFDEHPPTINVFDDRIEIISNGEILLKKEEFFKGKSSPVNKELMRIFEHCGFAENAGQGVPFIIEKYGEESYVFDENFVTVKIPFNDMLSIDQLASKNQELTFNEFETLLKEKKIPFNESLEPFDEAFKLKNKNGKYNEIAYLLSDQFNEIKVNEYSGYSMILIGESLFKGCIFKVFSDVKKYLSEKYKLQPSEDLYFLLDAFLCNDYSKKEYPEINIYKYKPKNLKDYYLKIEIKFNLSDSSRLAVSNDDDSYEKKINSKLYNISYDLEFYRDFSFYRRNYFYCDDNEFFLGKNICLENE